MRHLYSAPAMALLGFTLIAGTAPASAQVARPQAAADITLGANVNSGDAQVTQVRHRGWRHRGWRHRHYDRGWGWGAGAAGLATGLIVGSAIANSQARAQADSAIEYCMQRFRSYDPRSGTYLGYDGERHPCP